MAHLRFRSVLVLPVLAVLLAGATACSSDGGSDAVPATTAGASSTTTTGDDASTTTAAAGPAGSAIDRYAGYETTSYDDPTHWVCRPDRTDDVCHGDLNSTTIEADGKLTGTLFELAEDPPIDCFYVYPTISQDKTAFSDWNASPDEEGYVTANQAARLGSQCRVFAPVYRQATLSGLTSRLNGSTDGPTDTGDPFADVLDAFRTYMAQDNDGRGFVLIGHSQGAGLLNELLQTEIDPNADVRRLLVSAYLAGSSVAVPEGEVVGGDLTSIPLCTKADEAGCIVTWATFRSTAPPPADSFFGRPRDGADGLVSGCVNPAAPGSDGSAETHPYFPADARASILTALGSDPNAKPWVDPSAGAPRTPYVTVPGLVSVRCVEKDGFHYLEATVDADPADPRADDIPGDLTPQWGLHLVDVNLVMGDIVTLVGEQAEAYAR